MQAARRTVALAAAIILALLIPASLVVRAAHAAVFETEPFVELSSALIRERSLRDELADSMTGSIMESIDVDGLVPAAALRAAGITTTELTERLESVVRTGVGTAVDSEAFGVLWEESSRAAHASFVAAMEGDTPTGVTVDVSPLGREVASRLQDDGAVGRLVQLAELVPDDVTLRFEVLDGSSVDTLRDVRNITSVLRWLLPLFSVATAAAVVALWPSRRSGMRVTGAALSAAAVIVFVARAAAADRVGSATGEGADTARAVFDVATSGLTAPALVLLVVGGATVVAASVRRRQASGSA